MSLLTVLLFGFWQAGIAQASNLALPPPDGALVAAAERELKRALTMQLPEQPKPYYVAYEFLDGEVATASARAGQWPSVSASSSLTPWALPTRWLLACCCAPAALASPRRPRS